MKKLLIPLILLLSSCTHLYKHYDYHSGKEDILGGEVVVVLNPGFKNISQEPKVSEHKNPYCTVVFFTHPDTELQGSSATVEIESVITISSVDLNVSDTETGNLKKYSSRVKEEHRDKVYFNAASCNIIIPKHEAIWVKGKVTLNGKTQDFKVLLKPDYWERRSNDTYDAIMSV